MRTLRFLITMILIAGAMLGIQGCSAEGPQPIHYGKESCAHCRMTISDARFGSQLVTTKGRTYNFDDVQCLLSFVEEGGVARSEVAHCYLSDYANGGKLLPADSLLLLKSESLKSPMRGDIAAFTSEAALEAVREVHGGEHLTWTDLWK